MSEPDQIDMMDEHELRTELRGAISDRLEYSRQLMAEESAHSDLSREHERLKLSLVELRNEVDRLKANSVQRWMRTYKPKLGEVPLIMLHTNEGYKVAALLQHEYETDAK